jgi:hypothetical protein
MQPYLFQPEKSGNPDDLRWGHFGLSKNLKDRWIAESGAITVHTYRMPKEENYIGFLTSIQIAWRNMKIQLANYA